MKKMQNEHLAYFTCGIAVIAAVIIIITLIIISLV